VSSRDRRPSKPARHRVRRRDLAAGGGLGGCQHRRPEADLDWFGGSEPAAGKGDPRPRWSRVRGEAHLGLAGVAVVGVVAPVDPTVGWVVAPAVGLVVGTDEALEEDAAAVWSALRDAQPVMARAAMTTAVAMIRTGRMVTPPNSYDPSGPGQQPSPGRSQHGRRSASWRPRTGLDPVAIFQPMSHPALPVGRQRKLPGTGPSEWRRSVDASRRNPWPPPRGSFAGPAPAAGPTAGASSGRCRGLAVGGARRCAGIGTPGGSSPSRSPAATSSNQPTRTTYVFGS
jgi:hypothetical protein